MFTTKSDLHPHLYPLFTVSVARNANSLNIYRYGH